MTFPKRFNDISVILFGISWNIRWHFLYSLSSPAYLLRDIIFTSWYTMKMCLTLHSDKSRLWKILNRPQICSRYCLITTNNSFLRLTNWSFVWFQFVIFVTWETKVLFDSNLCYTCVDPGTGGAHHQYWEFVKQQNQLSM